MRIPEWQTGKPVVADLHGPVGTAGSSYTSRRGRLSAQPPHELVTRTDAYLGLRLTLTSLLSERSGGTDLSLRGETHWRRRLGPLAWLIELAILSPREARKELAALKALVEADASDAT
jgi:hypothetical protein